MNRDSASKSVSGTVALSIRCISVSLRSAYRSNHLIPAGMSVSTRIHRSQDLDLELRSSTRLFPHPSPPDSKILRHGLWQVLRVSGSSPRVLDLESGVRFPGEIVGSSPDHLYAFGQGILSMRILVLRFCAYPTQLRITNLRLSLSSLVCRSGPPRTRPVLGGRACSPWRSYDLLSITFTPP